MTSGTGPRTVVINYIRRANACRCAARRDSLIPPKLPSKSNAESIMQAKPSKRSFRIVKPT